jgi:hypothetical protein
MVHFAVLVCTQEKPDRKALHKILLPWHEYETTRFGRQMVRKWQGEDPRHQGARGVGDRVRQGPNKAALSVLQ